VTGRHVARDKRLGAQPGITAVLHTWTRKLELHPHLHCIVTGGGLDGSGCWKPAADNHLFPVKVLAKLFRGKLMAALAGERKAGEFVVDSTRTPTPFARLRNAYSFGYSDGDFSGPERRATSRENPCCARAAPNSGPPTVTFRAVRLSDPARKAA
jgi:hypothetical protein